MCHIYGNSEEYAEKIKSASSFRGDRYREEGAVIGSEGRETQYQNHTFLSLDYRTYKKFLQ